VDNCERRVPCSTNRVQVSRASSIPLQSDTRVCPALQTEKNIFLGGALGEEQKSRISALFGTDSAPKHKRGLSPFWQSVYLFLGLITKLCHTERSPDEVWRDEVPACRTGREVLTMAPYSLRLRSSRKTTTGLAALRLTQSFLRSASYPVISVPGSHNAYSSWAFWEMPRCGLRLLNSGRTKQENLA
jgi:hypothetical protein